MAARGAARMLVEVGPRPRLLAAEAAHRARRRLDRRRLRRRYTAAVALPPPGARLRLPELELPGPDTLPLELEEAHERLRAEAEVLLSRRVDLLGSGPVHLGEPIDWHVDAKSGYRWPAVFYQDVEVTRLDDSSDAKWPWELSRCHHLLTLARAARIFEEPRYATEVEHQLASWLDANPPGIGINWSCPMEIAIRAVNWIWTLATLEPWWPFEPELRARVVESLQAHGRHVEQNLEGSPYLRGNHYLADLSGLFVLGCALEGDPAAERWRTVGRDALEQEIRAQVHDDGLGFEASLSYHGLALELFLVAKIAAAWRAEAFRPDFNERLRRMAAASAALRHPGGRIPAFGDGDSGRILPGSEERPPTHDQLLWLAAAVLGERHLDGVVDAEVAWTLGLPAWKRAAAAPAAPAPPRSFPDAGFYVLSGGGAFCVVRCGDVGQNGRGGHAHNDLLSYELSREEPLVIDSGTYAYTSDLAARNAFRSTAAHNTVRVDGEEINPIPAGDAFRLPGHARPAIVEAVLDGRRARLVVTHDGYRRLRRPVEHRRTFTLDRATGVLEVLDELRGPGKGLRLLETFVHLVPGARAEVVGHRVDVTLRETRTCISFCGYDSIEVLPGWVSDSFGARERAPVVVARIRRALPAILSYRLLRQEDVATAANAAEVGAVA